MQLQIPATYQDNRTHKPYLEKLDKLFQDWKLFRMFAYIRDWVERKVRRCLIHGRKRLGFGWTGEVDTMPWAFIMMTRQGTAMLKIAASPVGLISLWEKLAIKCSGGGDPLAMLDMERAGNMLVSK